MKPTEHLPTESQADATIATTAKTPNDKTEQAPPKQKSRRAGFALLLAGLSLIITIGGIFYIWQQFKLAENNLALQATTIQTLSTDLAENKAALHTQEQLTNHLQNTLQQLVNQTNNNNNATTDWLLSEAAYLIHLASFNINVEQNIPVATKLLQAADTRLNPVTDPKVIPVRRALAEDILALQAIPPLDTAGIVLRLEAAQAAIAQLPILPNTLLPNAANNIQATISETPTKSWKQALANTLSSLKGLVAIRHNEETIEPLATSEDQIYRVRNLQLKLMLAQWALLQKQPDVYAASLQQATAWLERYFTQSPTAQNIIDQLKQLQKINLRPALPDLSASVKAIEQAVNKPTAATIPQPLPPQPAPQTSTEAIPQPQSPPPQSMQQTSDNAAPQPTPRSTSTTSMEI